MEPAYRGPWPWIIDYYFQAVLLLALPRRLIPAYLFSFSPGFRPSSSRALRSSRSRIQSLRLTPATSAARRRMRSCSGRSRSRRAVLWRWFLVVLTIGPL